MVLNGNRVAQVREFLGNAARARTAKGFQWRRHVAQQLLLAASARRDARMPWDYTVTWWVCQCCMLADANGECCADDEHGGDSVEPLSCVRPEDTLANDSSEDDSSHNPFSSSQCDGCGSWLAGDRYRMTLFVNDRRNRPVSV